MYQVQSKDGRSGPANTMQLDGGIRNDTSSSLPTIPRVSLLKGKMPLSAVFSSPLPGEIELVERVQGQKRILDPETENQDRKITDSEANVPNLSIIKQIKKKKSKTNIINKLLMRPEFAEEMKDKALDIMDKKIKLNQRKHDEEIARLDLEIEEEVRNREELTKRQCSNAIL